MKPQPASVGWNSSHQKNFSMSSELHNEYSGLPASFTSPHSAPNCTLLQHVFRRSETASLIRRLINVLSGMKPVRGVVIMRHRDIGHASQRRQLPDHKAPESHVIQIRQISGHLTHNRSHQGNDGERIGRSVIAPVLLLGSRLPMSTNESPKTKSLSKLPFLALVAVQDNQLKCMRPCCWFLCGMECLHNEGET